MTYDMVVFGEVLADRFPDRDVIGGAPFNVARNLAWLGLPVLMISRIARDAVGQQILSEMQTCGAAGIELGGIQFDELLPSGQVRVVLDPQSHNHHFEILPEQAYDKIDADLAVDAWRQWHQGRTTKRSILCCGTVAQRDPVSAGSLLQLRQQMAGLCFVDLNLRTGQYTDAIIHNSLRMADILKLNQDEWQYLIRMLPQQDASADELQAAVPQRRSMQRMLQHYQLQALLVTLGADGYCYLDSEGQHIEGGKVQVSDLVDTVGAGDAFASIFLLGFSLGWDLTLSLQRAQAFAASICQQRGAVGNADFYAGWRQCWQLEGDAGTA